MLPIAAFALTPVNARVAESRLDHAAHEFEAQMMKELLRPVTSVGELDETHSGSGGALAEFAGEALGQSLSKGGGFGIATAVLRSLSHNGSDSRGGSTSGRTSSTRSIPLKSDGSGPIS